MRFDGNLKIGKIFIGYIGNMFSQWHTADALECTIEELEKWVWINTY